MVQGWFGTLQCQNQASILKFSSLIKMVPTIIRKRKEEGSEPSFQVHLQKVSNFHLHSIIVHSGFYSKLPQTVMFINNRYLFLSGKSKIKAPANSVSDESLLHGSQMLIFSLHTHRTEGASELSRIFYKNTNSQSSPKGPIFKYHHTGAQNFNI